MIEMCYHGTIRLVVKMDDKTNRCFWADFYVRKEHVVSNLVDFLRSRTLLVSVFGESDFSLHCGDS